MKDKKKDDIPDKTDKDKEKDKREVEPSFEILQNPARVLRQQLKVIQLVEGAEYVPVKDLQIGGIVMAKHAQSDKEEELVEPVAGKSFIALIILKLLCLSSFRSKMDLKTYTIKIEL